MRLTPAFAARRASRPSRDETSFVRIRRLSVGGPFGGAPRCQRTWFPARQGSVNLRSASGRAPLGPAKEGMGHSWSDHRHEFVRAHIGHKARVLIRDRTAAAGAGYGSKSLLTRTFLASPSPALRCLCPNPARPTSPSPSKKPRICGALKSGRPDLNRGPHRPERCALPGCATPRIDPVFHRQGRMPRFARPPRQAHFRPLPAG
jgi:hypothetical protein